MSTPLTKEEAMMILEAKLPNHTFFVMEQMGSFKHPTHRNLEVAFTVSVVPGLSGKACDQFNGFSLNEALSKALTAI